MKLQSRDICDADPTALTIGQALERIKSTLPRVRDSETIGCDEALGRISSCEVYSSMSVPSFRASAMDGYAVRVADCDGSLKVAGKSMAGHPGIDRLEKRTCQRIMTGARVPDDADAVIQQENVEPGEDSITVRVRPVVGLNIREPGSDSRDGALLIGFGCRLGPAELALLAAHGIDRVSVYRRLTIAVFSTGDELRNAGSRLETGQIYDANRPLLQAILDNNAISMIDLGISKDSTIELRKRLDAAHDADMIISSGGVSVGDADHVRQVLERIGKVSVWKIAVKPGRPLTFGLSHSRQAYFGLPGNPVSAAITSLFFVKPAIRYMLGSDSPLFPPLQVRLVDTLNKHPGRIEYQRAILQCNQDAQWQVSTTGLQDSHVLTSLHRANCLIELDTNSTGANPGDIVRVYPFTHFSDPLI
ncbi:MAG: molybdopterin molybdotransferase MoeA [Granulosicoccus sp.]|nr:molybdopterin molybdotransferase MoeA [Granulosicoccus sp.]